MVSGSNLIHKTMVSDTNLCDVTESVILSDRYSGVTVRS
jgi:hypothetical protein